MRSPIEDLSQPFSVEGCVEGRFTSLGLTSDVAKSHVVFLLKNPVNANHITVESTMGFKLSPFCVQYIMYSAGIEVVGSLFVCATLKTFCAPLKLVVGTPIDGETYSSALDVVGGTLAYRGSKSSVLLIPESIDIPLLIKDGDST